MALGAWTLLMYVAASYRLVLWHLHRRNPAQRSAAIWLRQYTAGCFFAGIAWGSIQLLALTTEDVIALAFLLMLLFGVMSSAVPILSPHLPAYFFYTVPQVAMLGIALFQQQELALLPVAGALVIYMIMLSLFARNAHGLFIARERLSIEKQALVDRLHEENRQREAIIQERTSALQASNEELGREVQVRLEAEEALKEQKQSLQRMAHHDALTGLPNRVLLTDRIQRALLRRHAETSLQAVLFIDLDHFKEINDSLGHSVGDELLKRVAGRLQRCVRREDTVARLGGDEFILLAEQLDDAAAASTLAEKILATFEEPFEAPFEAAGQSLSVEASIGISLYPGDGDDPETLLRNADAAMYKAKADGRGTFRFYSAEMTERAQHRLALENALKRALDNRELELYYQPQLSLLTGAVLGAEALLRWNHPEQGLMTPDQFIPIAEQSALINRTGSWVLSQACQQLRQWQDEGLAGFKLAINLSGRDLWNNPLEAHIDAALAESGCRPETLELEITESFLMHQPEKTRALLHALRDRGISVAIDDFGTGYSALGYLKQYPMNRLKIDRSFVEDVTDDPYDAAIVRAVIALGHSLGLTVIGEGVETAAQADFLRAAGCDLAQGYLFARPMPADAFRAFLRERLPAGEAPH